MLGPYDGIEWSNKLSQTENHLLIIISIIGYNVIVTLNDNNIREGKDNPRNKRQVT
jgi:hypothetical protein